MWYTATGAHIRVCADLIWSCLLIHMHSTYAFSPYHFVKRIIKLIIKREKCSPCPCSMLHVVEISHFMKFHIILTCIISYKIGFQVAFCSQQKSNHRARMLLCDERICAQEEAASILFSHFQIDETNKQSHVSTLATNKCILILMKQIDFQPHPYISTCGSACTCTCVYFIYCKMNNKGASFRVLRSVTNSFY